jgi:hypothetical protein
MKAMLLALMLASASASANAPEPRFVIDCGSLRGSGGAAFEIGGTRFVTTFKCPQDRGA